MRRFFAIAAVVLLAMAPIVMADVSGATGLAASATAGITNPKLNIDPAKLKNLQDFITANVKDPSLKQLAMQGKNGKDVFNAVSMKVGQMKWMDLSNRVKLLSPAEKMKMADLRVNLEGLRLADKVTQFAKNNAAAMAACQVQIDALQGAATSAAASKDVISAVDGTDLKTLAATTTTATPVTIAVAKADLQNFKTLWKDAAECLVSHRVDNALANHKAALDKRMTALNAIDFTKVDAVMAKLESSGAQPELVTKIKDVVTTLKDRKTQLLAEGQKLLDSYAQITDATPAAQKAQWVAESNKFGQLANQYLLTLKDIYSRMVRASSLAVQKDASSAELTRASADLSADRASIAQMPDVATEVASATVDPGTQAAIESTAATTGGETQ
jgi:hypothetical protein